MHYIGKYQKAEVDGLSVSVNLPHAVKQQFDSDGNEITQGLPPYAPVDLAVVDEYEGAPNDWMRGSAKTGSFFFPVKEGRGLWLDFNGNRGHKHHVAVVVSIQGVNAVTGQKMVGFKPRLERYDEKCPVHGVKFGHDRFCEKCGFKWPPQNYLATTGTPSGSFWLDGFRNQKGEIRQFIFTPEEMERGVAQHLIGDDRVFAIGVAFFLSKEPKPEPKFDPNVLRSAGIGSLGGGDAYKGGGGGYRYSWSGGSSWSSGSPKIGMRSLTKRHFAPPTVENCVRSNDTMGMGGSDFIGFTDVDAGGEETLELAGVDSTRFEVGAGARVRQTVHSDPESLDFWQDEPAAVIYMNYANEATVQEILGSPRVDMTAGGEGFMKDIPTGDPPQGQPA